MVLNRKKPKGYTDAQIKKIRQAGLVVAQIHQALAEAVAPGVSLLELDNIARDVIKAAGATSNFRGYHGYPRHTCISVNDVVVHGIPDQYVLQPGDIVSMDCGAVLNGWHGDACFTVVLPGGEQEVTARRERLSAQTYEAMWHGIAAMATGQFVSDIGNAIDDYVESLPGEERPDIVLDFTGHGIGTSMHMEPTVLNYRTKQRGAKLHSGMVLCIEPILTSGKQANRTLADGWTVVTKDGSDACHWEHEVALHSKGIWVLTAPDGGTAELARFGITPVPLD